MNIQKYVIPVIMKLMDTSDNSALINTQQNTHIYLVHAGDRNTIYITECERYVNNSKAKIRYSV